MSFDELGEPSFSESDDSYIRHNSISSDDRKTCFAYRNEGDYEGTNYVTFESMGSIV